MSELTVSPTLHRLRDERGFMLIEVLVSAVILVTASLAIFATLTRADTAAGQQQIRVAAANFAQSELERIRSLPVEDVMTYAQQGTHKINRNGITFTENVVAKWVSDGGDEPECTGQEGGLDYMRTTVTLSWPGMGELRPVSITSLFTPNAGAGGTTGSLSVHVIDRDGKPVQGVGISIAGQNGGGNYSSTTNVNGCVVFGFIAEDTYNLTGQKNGYVDQDSNATIKDTPNVVAATTTKVEYSYDSGGWTGATFKTTLGASVLGVTLGTPQPSYPPHFQIWHAQQTFPGGYDVDFPTNLTPGTTAANRFITFNPSVPATNSVSAYNGQTAASPDLLFPFSSPYTIYAGNCAANATQGSAATFVNVARQQYQNAGQVNIPALQVTVYSGTIALPGSPVGGARVMVNFGCGTWTRYTATKKAPTPLLVPAVLNDG
ncbi:MAG: carboxypeptidase regulatory-like domain-containing protein, partial [Solirubrobacteraceae bacterium]